MFSTNIYLILIPKINEVWLKTIEYSILNLDFIKAQYFEKWYVILANV